MPTSWCRRARARGSPTSATPTTRWWRRSRSASCPRTSPGWTGSTSRSASGAARCSPPAEPADASDARGELVPEAAPFLFLSQEDVVAAGGLEMAPTIDVVREALRLHAEGDAKLPPKPMIRWGEDVDAEERTGRI